MDCRELEDRLEALLDGELDELESRRCARHLETCPSCRELAEPLTVASAPPEDLVDAVLASTSGSPCGRSQSLLCEWLDGETAAADGELMAAHLDTCADCRSLAAAMTRLAAELPELAELRPDPGFVEAVLAATLPVRVRLRRWWAAVWPQWVRRPRFASEAAFVATMALVIVFATPGSPLEAVPTKALVLARTDPAARLEAPVAQLEARLEAPVAALGDHFTTQVKEPISARYARGETRVRSWAKAAEARGRAVTEDLAAWLGTSRERLASLLESADEKASDSADTESNTNQEKP
jgi:anti-sigma factor RsiW